MCLRDWRSGVVGFIVECLCGAFEKLLFVPIAVVVVGGDRIHSTADVKPECAHLPSQRHPPLLEAESKDRPQRVLELVIADLLDFSSAFRFLRLCCAIGCQTAVSLL